MPAGYEKIRDAFMAKGMSEDEAKTRAAKIWNKHHKGDEAVGAHYDKEHMSRYDSFSNPAFDMVRPTGGSTLLGVPGPQSLSKMGDQIGALIRGLRKRDKIKAGFPNSRAKTILPHQVGDILTPRSLEAAVRDVIELSLKKKEYEAAEKLLKERMEKLGMEYHPMEVAGGSQNRVALPEPIATHPKNPNTYSG